ncbi:MAG TPA: RES family NAD+ phosphorylase [Jatrophihabitans sp.]
MGNIKPPVTPAGVPTNLTLTAGTVFYRVHQSRHPADSFSPVLSHRYYGGGRFDATADDSYLFIYMGSSVDVAVSETLLRDLDLTGSLRTLTKRKIIGRRISAVELTGDIQITSLLSGRDLGALSQDPWLTTADPRDYAQTRHWGHWIRNHLPGTAGFVWPSRREPSGQCYILFGDRLPPGVGLVTMSDPQVPPGNQADFDTPVGLRALRRRLNAYGVSITR